MSFEAINLDEDALVKWSNNDLRMLKYMLENDGLQFMRYFFKQREGIKMLRNWHHYLVEAALDGVFRGEITRLIINLAPGYTKTEQAVLNFITRGLALNPRAKFIHASYSGDLALENSSKIKDTIQSDAFQQLWPMQVRVDTKSKKRWFTEAGGGMLAAPAGGQITGFRAGRMESGFTGAFVIDDPVKPEDAYSPVKRPAVNNRFNNTMRSRLAVETVPMVIIMQRIHDDDLSGYLLRGGSGDEWHHLSIPTFISEDTINRPYPTDFTHGRAIHIPDLLASMNDTVPYDFALC